MIGINAARDVAPVKDVLCRCNRAMHEHPHRPMRLARSTSLRAGNLAVAVGIYASRPQPAPIGLPREKDREPVNERLTKPVRLDSLKVPDRAYTRLRLSRQPVAILPTDSGSNTGCYVNLRHSSFPCGQH